MDLTWRCLRSSSVEDVFEVLQLKMSSKLQLKIIEATAINRLADSVFDSAPKSHNYYFRIGSILSLLEGNRGHGANNVNVSKWKGENVEPKDSVVAKFTRNSKPWTAAPISGTRTRRYLRCWSHHRRCLCCWSHHRRCLCCWSHHRRCHWSRRGCCFGWRLRKWTKLNDSSRHLKTLTLGHFVLSKEAALQDFSVETQKS